MSGVVAGLRLSRDFGDRRHLTKLTGTGIGEDACQDLAKTLPRGK
jgi:hypothetical protein